MFGTGEAQVGGSELGVISLAAGEAGHLGPGTGFLICGGVPLEQLGVVGRFVRFGGGGAGFLFSNLGVLGIIVFASPTNWISKEGVADEKRE